MSSSSSDHLHSGRNRNKNITLVRRFPLVKTFRTHSLGLTLAFVSVVTAATFHYIYHHSIISWATPVSSIFFFALLTYNFDYLVRQIVSAFMSLAKLAIFVAVVIIALVIWGLSLIQSVNLAGNQSSLLMLWSQFGFLFIAAYLSGMLFAYLYNALVYFFVTTFQHSKLRIAFAYDKTKSLNIIKSPAEREEIAFLKAVRPFKYYVETIRHAANINSPRDVLLEIIHEAWHRVHKRDQEHFLIFVGLGINDSWEALRSRITSELANNKSDMLRTLERDFEPIVERALHLKEHKLYNYEIKNEPPQPFTIAFVANPTLLRKNDDMAQTVSPETDPIMKDRKLFFRTVDRALRAMEGNDVFGRPEIWSRVRILTWFPAETSNAAGTTPTINLVQDLGPQILEDERISDNMLTPSTDMTSHFINEMFIPGLDEHNDLKQAVKVGFSGLSTDPNAPDLPHIDVITAVSASETNTRASARYANYLESQNGASTNSHTEKEYDDPPCAKDCECRPSKENEFYFNPDPHGTKMRKKPNNKFEPEFKPYLILKDDGAGGVNEELYDGTKPEHKSFEHEDFTEHPGRIAVNALTATGHTFVHELAHAISSAQNGIIADEYINRAYVIDHDAQAAANNTSGSQNNHPLFYINRIEQKRPNDHRVAAVHQVFGNYNCVDYRSDLYPPSAEENWNIYFPEREDPNVACTMDRAYGAHRFDKLLSRFIYDRMIAKVNRR